MKRLCKTLLPSMLALCLLASSALGEALYTHRVTVDPRWTGAYEPFLQAHLGVEFITSDDFYYTTEELLRTLNTADPKFDLFQLNTDAFDCQGVMAMGYCADLSESKTVQEAFSRMHAPIRAKLMLDGKIYGIPHSIAFSTFSWCQNAWDAAGLTEKDVPTTYPELLDFLEQWAQRITRAPEEDISVCNMFDETLYGPYSYAYYLLCILMDTYVMHCEYTGVPLRFDTPLFRELLERTQTIGASLYQAEAKKKGKMQLFDNSLNGYSLLGAAEGMSHVIPLRITEDQPLLIKALMDVYCVGAGGGQQELAMAYLESALTHMDHPSEVYAQTYLFTDSQPLERPDLEGSQKAQQARIEETERELGDPDLSKKARAELEEQRASQQRVLEEMGSEEYRYLISPEWLADYKAYAHLLYFPGPGVYSMGTEESQGMRGLVESFSKGNITVDEFIQGADELARQWEMKNQ